LLPEAAADVEFVAGFLCEAQALERASAAATIDGPILTAVIT
jgi:hypothetical protein